MGDDEDQDLSSPRSTSKGTNSGISNSQNHSAAPSSELSPNQLSSSRLHAGDSLGIPALGVSDDSVSPFGSPHRYQSDFHYRPLRASSTLRHVQRVSKRAALASKKVIWDSNDNAIDAAQSAVDQWEEGYNALRGLIVASTQSAFKLYGAAKAGATGLEHGILVPIRDWVLLPAFDAAEKTVGFLQSDQAHQVASHSLQLAFRVPFVGPTVLAPSMVICVQLLQASWQIAQYPIPSRESVRNSVDFALTGTKWALSTAVREVFLYMKRADATITRTLSHTRWKVLGSGPYATLDKLNKQEVIDHICERYFSPQGTIARYELAAHIRAHNLPLYLDLVLTGLLRERGRELTKADEWLSSCPSYRKNAKFPFLLPNFEAFDMEGNRMQGTAMSTSAQSSVESRLTDRESALWFRLPYINGKRPSRDVPWVRFNGEDRAKLERRYLDVFREGKCKTAKRHYGSSTSISAKSEEALMENALHAPTKSDGATVNARNESSCQSKDLGDDAFSSDGMAVTSGHPTVAQWHIPDLERDVMVDQKRYSVSYYHCCPRCRQKHDPSNSLDPSSHDTKDCSSLPKFGDVCRNCADSKAHVTNYWMASSILSPPPLSMVMRPNFWRHHGPGKCLV
jgi:hypothetical protein